MADEVPIQLDLEGGFVVGEPASASASASAAVVLVDDDEFFGGSAATARRLDGGFYDYDQEYHGDGDCADSSENERATEQDLDEEYFDAKSGQDHFMKEDEDFDGSESNRSNNRGRVKSEENAGREGAGYANPNENNAANQDEGASRNNYYLEQVQHQQMELLSNSPAIDTNNSRDNKFSTSPNRPRKIREPKTLLQKCIQTIAQNIEKYPPHAMAMLSEYQWENVIDARIVLRAKQAKTAAAVSASLKVAGSNTLVKKEPRNNLHLLPAVSVKQLEAIEAHSLNGHLAKSKKVDEIVWKDIVNYNFKVGGMTRPKCLEFPLGVLEEKLVKFAEDLTGLLGEVVGEVEYYDGLKKKKGKSKKKPTDHGGENEEDEGGANNNAIAGRKRKRPNAPRDDLFGQESENESDQGDDANNVDGNVTDQPSYETYLQQQTYQRTSRLLYIIQSLIQSPMDVKLLSSTGIGKAVTKFVKGCKKLLTKAGLSNHSKWDRREYEEKLMGNPIFWGAVDFNNLPTESGVNNQQQSQSQAGTIQRGEKEELFLTPLEILEQILQNWKDMAFENGVPANGNGESGTPSKKQKLANESSSGGANRKSHSQITTCGRNPKTSIHQHLIDMKLLHSSPDWRSLYQSLVKRSDLICKSQGEKMRSIRENLEKGRPKIGKVVLKKAVGRVRGMTGGSTSGLNPSTRTGIVGGGLSGNGVPSNPAKRDERREAILNGSRGIRAQASKPPSSSTIFGKPSSSGGKFAQLKSESRVAATWSKGSQASVKKISHSSSSSYSAFGASVAFATGSAKPRANGTRVVGKKQLQVQLKEGRQMRLPSSSASGLAKPKGVFSSLQQKLTKGEKRSANRK